MCGNQSLQGSLRALVALTALLSATAMATGPDGRPTAPSAVDAHAELASFTDLVAVDSYYRSRSNRQVGSDDVSQAALWGIQARSAIPVIDAQASFDYSMFVPDEHDLETISNEANHLLRLSVQDHWRTVNYGASVYSVGTSFMQQPLARQQLNSTGLAQPGQGREYWVNGRLPILDLQPSVQRRELMRDDNGAEFRSGATILGLSSPVPTGRMFLRNAFIEDQNGGADAVSRYRWELGANIRPLGGALLSPLYARESRTTPLGFTLVTHTTALNLNTVLLDTTRLNLNLQHNSQETIEGILRTSAANLNVTTPLRLGKIRAPGFTVSAGMGYRDLRGARTHQPNEGVSVNLSLNYQVGG